MFAKKEQALHHSQCGVSACSRCVSQCAVFIAQQLQKAAQLNYEALLVIARAQRTECRATICAHTNRQVRSLHAKASLLAAQTAASDACRA